MLEYYDIKSFVFSILSNYTWTHIDLRGWSYSIDIDMSCNHAEDLPLLYVNGEGIMVPVGSGKIRIQSFMNFTFPVISSVSTPVFNMLL